MLLSFRYNKIKANALRNKTHLQRQEINFLNDVQDLYRKNDKTLSYSWFDIPYSWIGSFNNLKMSNHPTYL